MNIVGITGLCIVVTVICKFYDKTNKEYTFILSLVTVVFILLLSISFINPIISEVRNIFNIANVSSEYLDVIFKSIGICYLTQLGCDYCKDAGENALAGELEIAGKISLLIIALPLFSAIIEIVKDLLTL